MSAAINRLLLALWCAMPSRWFKRGGGSQVKAPKKKPQTIAADTGLSKEHNAKFTGTDNPRHLRAIAALERRPMPRESLDAEAGCRNSPELVAELRRRGLEVPCKRSDFVDRDGFVCRPGVYSLTLADRSKLQMWKARRNQPQGGAHG